MGKRIEDTILDILNSSDLNEEVDYEVVGGPTPSATLQGPLDYAKNVQKATVPQAHAIPGVGEIGNDDADKNASITKVVDNIGEDEDLDTKDDDDDKKDKDGLDETFASLLAKLAEEEDEDDDDDDLDEDEGETSLKDPKDDFGTPDETLPDVESNLDSPDKLVTKAPGIKVAEDEGETALKDPKDDFGTPDETLPDVDSMLDTPEKLVTKAVGAKEPDKQFEDEDEDCDDDKKKKDDMSEDIRAIFAGVKLSEKAQAKAATIFKAAVARRVNEEKSRVQKVASKKLKEAFAILKNRSERKQAIAEQKLTKQVDRYLNYVVENWMDQNRLAVERGIRTELAESFMGKLKGLFVEHYIEVPESKVDVVATLGKKVTNLESKLNETVDQNVKMRASLNAYRKEEVIRAVSAGLAETQREKLNKLAEGVPYTTRKEFAEKLTALRENYFPKKAAAPKKDEPLTEATKVPTGDVKQPKANDEMDIYVRQLSKMKKQ